MGIRLPKDETVFHHFSIKDKLFLLEYISLPEIGKAVHVEFHQRHDGNWCQDVLGNLSTSESLSLFRYIQRDATARLIDENLVLFSVLCENDSRANLYGKITKTVSKHLQRNHAILSDETKTQTIFVLYKDGMQEWIEFHKIHAVLAKHNLLQ
jgi:hypothetical protein